MNSDTAHRVLSKIDWEVKKQERFLNLLLRAQQYKPADREVILKNACWIDGTVETPISVRKKQKRETVEGLSKVI